MQVLEFRPSSNPKPGSKPLTNYSSLFFSKIPDPVLVPVLKKTKILIPVQFPALPKSPLKDNKYYLKLD
jgi:hypothetical protein